MEDLPLAHVSTAIYRSSKFLFVFLSLCGRTENVLDTKLGSFFHSINYHGQERIPGSQIVEKEILGTDVELPLQQGTLLPTVVDFFKGGYT